MFMLAMLESNLDCLYIFVNKWSLIRTYLVIYAHMHLCSWCGVSVNKGLHWPLLLFSQVHYCEQFHTYSHIFCLSILVDYLQTLFKIPKMNNHVAYFFMPTSIHYCLQLQQACHLLHYIYILKILSSIQQSKIGNDIGYIIPWNSNGPKFYMGSY
jgi:hypothetical protein